MPMLFDPVFADYLAAYGRNWAGGSSAVALNGLRGFIGTWSSSD